MTSVEDLYLYYCRRCDSGPCKPNSGVCAILQSHTNTTNEASSPTATTTSELSGIDLNQNYVGPLGLEPVLCVCRSAKATLRSVSLANNMLQDKEVVMITHYLSGRNTKAIIGDGGAAGSDDAEHQSQADLRMHPVTAATGTTATLSTTSVRQLSFLQKLDLRSNLIHDGSVPQLLYFLRMTPTLTELLLDGNQLSASAMSQIEAQVAHNRALLAADAQVHADHEAVAEEVRGANTQALSELRKLQRQQLPHTSTLHGSLTTETSGGYLSYPTWRRNPQFVLQTYFAKNPSTSSTLNKVEEFADKMRRNRKVIITLQMDAPIVSTRRFGFVIMRGHSVLRVVDVVTDPSVVVAESETSDSRCVLSINMDDINNSNNTSPNDGDDEDVSWKSAKTREMSPSPHAPLIAMVYCFTPGKSAGFTIKAELEDKEVVDTHPGTFVHLEPLNPTFDWIENSVDGAWTTTSENTDDGEEVVRNVSAGGPLTAASWRSNTAFRVCLGDGGASKTKDDASSSTTTTASPPLAQLITQEINNNNDGDDGGGDRLLTQAERAAALVADAQQSAAKIAAALEKATRKRNNGGGRPTTSTSGGGGSTSSRPSTHHLSKGFATLYIVLTQIDKLNTSQNDEDGLLSLKSIGFYLLTPDSRGRIPVYLTDNNKMKESATSSTSSSTTYPPSSLIAVCDHKSDQSVGITVDVPIHMLDFLIVPTTNTPMITGSYTLSVFSSCNINITRILPPGLTRAEMALVLPAPPADDKNDINNTSASGVATQPHSSMWSTTTLGGEFDETRCGGARELGGMGWTHNPSYEFTIGSGNENTYNNNVNMVVGSNLDVCLSIEPTFFTTNNNTTTVVDAASSRPGTAASTLNHLRTKLSATEIRVSLYALTRGGTNISEVQAANAASTSATHGGGGGEDGASSSTLPLFKRHELVSVGASPYHAMTANVDTSNPQEACMYVGTLSPGRYVVLINARAPGGGVGGGFGYRLRMMTSSSSSAFHPLTRRLFGLMGTMDEKNSFLLTQKKQLQEAKMKSDAEKTANNGDNNNNNNVDILSSNIAMSDVQQGLLEQALRTKALKDVDALFSDVGEGDEECGGEIISSKATNATTTTTKAATTTTTTNAAVVSAKHAPIVDAVNMSLSDRLRAQQLQDYEDEAAFDIQARSGNYQPQSSSSSSTLPKFAGCNVAELLRQNRKFVDREFPPSDSSLWLDPDVQYPDAPRVVGWKRATEIAATQALNIVDSTFSAQSGLGGGKMAKKTLETLLARRSAGLGIVRTATKAANASASAIDADSELALRTLENTLLGHHNNSHVIGGEDADATGGGGGLLEGGQSLSASSRRGQDVSAIMARLGEYATPPLFAGCAPDADQAHLGSHWYLSALACVLSKPTTFGRRFIVGYNAEAGVAQFRFFIDNAWRNVLVDDSLPVDGAGELCFATSASQGDFLIPLVEKAYAKAHNCYGALHGDLGVVKKILLGTDAPAQAQGSSTGVLVPSPPCATAGGGGSGPRPPSGSATVPSRPRPHSQPLTTTSDGNSNDVPRPGRLGGATTTAYPTQPNSRATVGLVSTLGGRSVVLSTDPARGNNSNPNRPSTARAAAITLTCPDNDKASYGATALAGSNSNAAKRPFYDHGGEPALVMLSQALTDFTGGIVQIFDNTPPTAGAMTRDGNSAGNNILPSDNYHAAGVLPPNMAIAISGSLYIDEDAYLRNRDTATGDDGASSTSSFTLQQRLKSKKDAVWETIKEGVFGSEKLFAGGLMKGTHGWQHKKHCGLVFDALYPFVEAKEADGKRLVKVLNNWGTGTSVNAGGANTTSQTWWKGKYAWGTTSSSSTTATDDSSSSSAGWTAALKTAVGYDIVDSAVTFWMSLEEVLYYFSHFFQVDYPSHRAKCEGGYGPSHVGGSLLNTSWVNNHQYNLTLHRQQQQQQHSNNNKDGNSSKDDEEYVDVVVGVHQRNDRARMPRHRNASYTYSKKPIGLALIQTTSCSGGGKETPLRRLAILTPSEHVTTLHPAALRDRYVTLRLPISKGENFVVMPYMERVGSGGVSAASSSQGRLFHHEADEAENPYLPPQAVDYCITVHCQTCPVALQAIPDDTRVSIEGSWCATNGVGIGGQVCVMPPTLLPLSTIPDPSTSPSQNGEDNNNGINIGAYTAGGPPSSGTWRCNPQFLLYPSKDCDVSITLRQCNQSSVEHIGFNIIDSADANLRRILHFPQQSQALVTSQQQQNNNKYSTSNTASSAAREGKDQIVLTAPHCNDSVITATVRLQGMGERLGRPYHIVPSCLRAGAEGDFSIEVTTNVPVRLTAVPEARDWKALSFNSAMTISEGNAGGCIQYPTWRNNPQYLLNFPTEKAGRLLIGVTNTSPSSSTSASSSVHEAIGLLLLRPDGWGKGRGRKLLLSNALGELVPTPTQDQPSDVPVNEPRRYPEQLHQQRVNSASKRNSSNTPKSNNTTTSLLEDVRTSSSSNNCNNHVGDIIVDSGAAIGHSEVLYDVALPLSASSSGGRHQHLILMPYTLHPLTEANLQITIYSTIDVEVDVVEERVGGYMRGLATTATSAGSIASFASNAQCSTRGLSNYSSLRPSSASTQNTQSSNNNNNNNQFIVAPPTLSSAALSLNKTFVCTAEGKWVPGVSAGGCRRFHLSSWVNNPFFRVTLLPSAIQAPKSEGLKMVIVAIQYPDGPERPEMKKLTTKSAGSKSNSSTRVVTMPPVVTNTASLAAFTASLKIPNNNAAAAGGDSVANNNKSGGSLSVAQRSPFGFDLVKAVDVQQPPSSTSSHVRAHSAATDVVKYEPIGSTRYTYESEVSALVDSSTNVFGENDDDDNNSTDPDSFYIVPHTYEPECGGYFKIIIYCNLPIQLTELQKGKRFW